MINIISMLTVSALFASAIGVILATLHGRGERVLAALAGKPVHADAIYVPASRVRVMVRPTTFRTAPPLRAAA